MSQENVEIVMGAFAAWNTGDMDAARRAWHPEATTRPPSRLAGTRAARDLGRRRVDGDGHS